MKNKFTLWISVLVFSAAAASAQSISITTTDSSICINHIATFTATVNCSNSYYILWMNGPFIQDTCYQPCNSWTTSLIAGTHQIYAQLFCNLQGNPWSNVINMVVDPCVGVEEFSDESLTMLYPNPSTDMVTINIHSPHGAEHQLSVFNSQGELVFVSKELKNNSVAFSVSEYEKGIYFYRITDRNGNNSGSGKFVIEK